MSKSTFIFIIMVLTLSAGSVFSNETQSPTLTTAALKEKADEVLTLSNVSARKEIDAVFNYIDRLLEENHLKEAEVYIVRGLQHFPWNLKYQMIYSEILEKKGMHAEAKEKASLVFKHAETDELIDRSRKLLNTYSDTKFQAISAIDKAGFSLVLVPFADCDKWLLLDIKEDIASILGIDVYIQTVKIEPPPANRDMRKRMIDGLRKRLIDQADDPQVTTGMKALRLTQADLSEEENVLKLMHHLMRTSDPNEIKTFDKYLKDSAGKNKQWDAMKLQDLLFKAVKPFSRKEVGYLGVTSLDIYAKDYNFLFGWTPPFCGIMSYHRFTAAFNDEIPNRERLAKRTLMQGLSSAGHIFGLRRCTTPTCARAYPNSLAEHDAKDAKLCPPCGNGFKKVFNK
jgi:predicted Zn-dependent protease